MQQYCQEGGDYTDKDIIEITGELAKKATLSGKVFLSADRPHVFDALVANELACRERELADLSGNYYIHLTEKALVLRTISKLERRIECRKDISLDWLNPV